MDYLERRRDEPAPPSNVFEGVRSIVAAGFVYGVKDEPSDDPRRGPRRALRAGKDYHEVLWRRLELLLDRLKRESPESTGRVVADTAPLLERDVARMAGLGWIGKNTMLIDKKLGSYTLLGFMLTDADLVADPPSESSHCGTCTRCLDACPTQAFDGPYVLNANRCISYWTIEQRGSLSAEAGKRLDGWVFGCDVCQEVCPWNRKAPGVREPALFPRDEWTDPDLIEWLERDDATWTALLKGTALKHQAVGTRAQRSARSRRTAREGSLARVCARSENDADTDVRRACTWAARKIEEEK